MGIKLITPIKEILNETKRQLKAIEEGIINRMDIIGGKFMTNAKTDLKIDTGAFPAKRIPKEGDPARGTGEYLDDTTNLRNSIGYFVCKNGKVVRGRVEGKAAATAAATALLATVPKTTGFQLIGVVGMDYASYMESRGFNVITSQAYVAMVDLEKALQDFAKAKNVTITTDSQGLATAMR